MSKQKFQVFIGGPWDLTKQAIDKRPPRVLRAVSIRGGAWMDYLRGDQPPAIAFYDTHEYRLVYADEELHLFKYDGIERR